MSEIAFLAEARSFEQLHGSLRLRADQLQVSRETLDEVTLLADGFCAKLLQPNPRKSILGKITLGPILNALGLRLLIVSDPETPAARGELPRRQANQVRTDRHWRNLDGVRVPKKRPAGRDARPGKPKRGKPYLSL